jgi:hypothetical protein
VEAKPLTPSPFTAAQTPPHHASVLKCKIEPPGVVAWWGADVSVVGISRANAELLVETLRDFLEPFVKE